MDGDGRCDLPNVFRVADMMAVNPDQLHLLSFIYDHLVDAVITVAADQRIVAVNRATTTLLGHAPEELIGQELALIVPQRFREAHRRGVSAYLADERRTRRTQGYVDVLALTRSGEELPASLSMTCTRHRGQLYMTGVLRDMRVMAAARATIAQQMQELAAANALLSQLADQDPLTGLLNRRAMQRELLRMWAASDVDRAPLAILLCDIDHFKQYNDTCGHLQGDSCLRAVASAIHGALSAHGSVARFGGEEYIVLLPPGAPIHVLEAAARIRNAVARLAIPHAASSAGPHVTLSIGAAVHGARHANPDALLRHADDALYAAKRQRNRCVLWGEHLLGS